MPFAFPSHQGLVAPLWRRWPHLFDMPAMCVGSALPDIVDGLVGLRDGGLGQKIGHSFLGLFLCCLPLGLVLWIALHWITRRLPRWVGSGFLARSWNLGVSGILAAPGPGMFLQHWRLICGSLLVGTFGHMFFDLISHGGFPWLYPTRVGRIFPDWWYAEWGRLPISFYPYRIGPHFLVWCFLSALGAYLLYKPAFKKPE